MIGLSNNIFKLHDLTMPCNENKICVERCKVNYPEENPIFATCVNEDSSHSFCFSFSEEQRDLLKILLPKFFPELHDLKMPSNKDIINLWEEMQGEISQEETNHCNMCEQIFVSSLLFLLNWKFSNTKTTLWNWIEFTMQRSPNLPFEMHEDKHLP